MKHLHVTELNWTKEPVVGLALKLVNHEVIDSRGNNILDNFFYHVGKDPETGKVAIIRIDLKPVISYRCVNKCTRRIHLGFKKYTAGYVCLKCNAVHSTLETEEFNTNERNLYVK